MALCLYLIRQARNQEFFQGRGVFLELGHLNDNSPSTQERKAPQGINHQFFYLDTLKNCILNETLYPQITTIRMFFPKLGHFFLIFEKGRGDLPPSPSLVTHLLGMHSLEDTNPNCPCIYYMVICTYIYIYIYIYIYYSYVYILHIDRQIDLYRYAYYIYIPNIVALQRNITLFLIYSYIYLLILKLVGKPSYFHQISCQQQLCSLKYKHYYNINTIIILFYTNIIFELIMDYAI